MKYLNQKKDSFKESNKMEAEENFSLEKANKIETMRKDRLTAFKVWISDIKDAELRKEEGFPSYVNVAGRKVSRVNVVASVVDKYESENYVSLVLDDGSAQIRLKAFGDAVSRFKEIKTGDLIMTISRLRNYNNENYLLPEIIKKVDAKYALLRRLELILEYGKRTPSYYKPEKRDEQTKLEVTEAPKADEAVENTKENMKEKVRLIISKLDEGEGVEISLLEDKFENKEMLKKIIEEFLGEGEAYEPRPGKIKLI